MSSIKFPFDEKESSVFGKIRIPIAKVQFLTKKSKKEKMITMIIDSGADYTLLPKFLSEVLEINLKKDSYPMITQGVGGKATVFIVKKPIKVNIGNNNRSIIVGFADNDFIPPLLGRHTFLETFKVTFENFMTTFS